MKRCGHSVPENTCESDALASPCAIKLIVRVASVSRLCRAPTRRVSEAPGFEVLLGRQDIASASLGFDLRIGVSLDDLFHFEARRAKGISHFIAAKKMKIK
jgi:hypothetical protein